MKSLSLQMVLMGLLPLVPLKNLGQRTIDAEDAMDQVENLPLKQIGAPSKNFIPLTLQAHEGRYRFGILDNYQTLADGSFIQFREQKEAYQKADKKGAEVRVSQKALKELLRVKYMADVFADMDRTLLVKKQPNKTLYAKEKNSLLAQLQLLKLANSITSLSETPRYFCNDAMKECPFTKNPERYYFRDVGRLLPWGGKRANEFAQQRAYTTYVSENLDALQKWGAALFPNDTIEAYFVIQTGFGTYDFEQKGFWIGIYNLSINDGIFSRMQLQPQNADERRLMRPGGIEVLFAIPPEKAEALAEKLNGRLYLVLDGTVHIKGIGKIGDRIDAEYRLSSPTLTFYQDDGLTRPVYEVSLENMVLK